MRDKSAPALEMLTIILSFLFFFFSLFDRRRVIREGDCSIGLL